jgi:lysophospholipase L1-like esterase
MIGGGKGSGGYYCGVRKVMDKEHAGLYNGAENCPARHERYIWPATEQEEAIIVADSLLKKVRHLKRTSVYAIPGATIERLTGEIIRGNIDISFQRAVCVCAGTNNLCRDTPAQICGKLATLVDTIRNRNVDCIIMISGIIIRPCDEDEDDEQRYTRTRGGDANLAKARRETNDMIKPMLQARGATLLATWKVLMMGSKANRYMYANDGLHLSDAGVYRITQYLINCLGVALPLFF